MVFDIVERSKVVASGALDKAKELDEKHHIRERATDVVERSKVAATDALEKAKEIDKKHQIQERTTNILILAGDAITDFVRRHRLLEQGLEGIKRFLNFATGMFNRESSSESYPASASEPESKKLK